MPYKSNSNILPAEKTIAALSYLTFGMVGFVWIIIGALMKQSLRPFLKYHIFQSIFISLLYFIVAQLIIFIINLLGYIPYLNALVGFMVYALTVPIIKLAWANFSVIQLLMFLFTIYLCVGAVRGKDSYVPWVSSIIKYNVR